ncbi:ATP-dependent Clp protease proteolytic subunit [Rhizobium sp. TRM96647]|uniref:ATP-dependent Clp protease proteolytic subunit n=1 Tax=unclassified Rhizobium TaxID=2613769 RepID=UPI0021E8A7A4|nr:MULTISPECIES: ATP-dependent Clp protease proteolytic subunit [unclassified Rhizobium]MCV3738086.1 ATP-dependent Clp protease proteolytic subunit [Rhizobium sp. TRM96647]MCV3759773.1 ATP-dependent Clp protease proteolytic subunit [Rhizobium sp. TRM96650]
MRQPAENCPMSDEEEKKTELPLGKETEANLFKSRSIFIYGGITQELAQKVNSQLVALAAASDEDIRIFVNSPGGHVESGDSIHDMVKFIKPKVWMIGTGWVASAGALIFVAAPKERRICLQNTRFLLHQPSGGTRGMASDIEIQAREIIKMNERLNKIFADATGQPIEKIAKDTDRDYWLSAKDAIEYGLVSRIVTSQADI